MASQSQSNVVLMSIKPEYANAIFDGLKLVEFRKQPFKHPVNHVIVYSSSPEKKIIGYFSLGDTDIGNPKTLWKRHRTVGAIEYVDYKAYFGDRDIGVAFQVKKAHRLKKPIALGRLKRDIKPPQSYCYLAEKYFFKLKNLNQQEAKRRSGVRSGH